MTGSHGATTDFGTIVLTTHDQEAHPLRGERQIKAGRNKVKQSGKRKSRTHKEPLRGGVGYRTLVFNVMETMSQCVI